MKEPTTHELIERYRLYDDAQWRQGFCAALTTTHGRRTMIRIRRMGEARDHGKSDMHQVGAVLSDALINMARGFVAAFHGRG